MTFSRLKTQQAFRRALTSYDTEATIQESIVDTLIEHALTHNPEGTRSLSKVFEFGCGTGFLTKRLFEHFEINQFIANDIVESCEKSIQNTIKNADQTSFIAGAIEEIHLPSQCDLIASSSVVQWVDNLPNLINNFHTALKPQGQLWISGFGPDHFLELSLLRSRNSPTQITQSMNYLSLDAWHQLLNKKFNINVSEVSRQVLWFDSVTEILLHLRKTGVNGNAGETWSKGKLAQFENDYTRHFAKNGKLPLSYHPSYILAYKS